MRRTLPSVLDEIVGFGGKVLATRRPSLKCGDAWDRLPIVNLQDALTRSFKEAERLLGS